MTTQCWTRRGLSVVVFGLALLSVAAKGKSCSAEIDPGDGSAAGWPVGQVPTPASVAKPMSCAWLDGDNCWKRLVAKATACSASVRPAGTFAADRRSCSYAEHGRWEFEGDVATPGPSELHVPVMNWRVLDAQAAPCMTGKILGIGRTLLDVEGEVVLFESKSLTTYQVTCADGSTFTNDGSASGAGGGAGTAGTAGAGGTAGDAGAAGSPGTAGMAGAGGGGATPGEQVCSSFGARWLARQTPGISIACDGATKRCALDLWGGPGGPVTPTTCGW